MDDITVKKVKPRELSKSMIMRLNYCYKIELGQFVVLHDSETDVLYVNDTVPEDDIEKFVTMAEYEGRNINDPDCVIADICDYIYEKYGYKTWFILQDYHRDREERREDAIAKNLAPEIYKQIKDFNLADETPDIYCSREKLISHIGELAVKEAGRNEGFVNQHVKYSFLYGYMLGNGMFQEEKVQEYDFKREINRGMEQVNDTCDLKMIHSLVQLMCRMDQNLTRKDYDLYTVIYLLLQDALPDKSLQIIGNIIMSFQKLEGEKDVSNKKENGV